MIRRRKFQAKPTLLTKPKVEGELQSASQPAKTPSPPPFTVSEAPIPATLPNPDRTDLLSPTPIAIEDESEKLSDTGDVAKRQQRTAPSTPVSAVSSSPLRPHYAPSPCVSDRPPSTVTFNDGLMSPTLKVTIDEDEELDVESVQQCPTGASTPLSNEQIKSAVKRRRISAFRHEEVIDPKKFTLADLVDWRPRTENTLRKKWAEKRQKALEIAANGPVAKVEQKPEAKFAGPRVRINEHGQMVIDEESLVVTNETDPDTWETVNDDLLPKKLNSMSFRKRYRTNANWSVWETDLFYEVLCATGTDFGLMHEFIPSRTRAEIKRKFNREEKTDPERIDEVLHHPTILDETFRERVLHLKQKVDAKLAEKLAAKTKVPSGRPRGRPRKIRREDDEVSVATNDARTSREASES